MLMLDRRVAGVYYESCNYTIRGKEHIMKDTEKKPSPCSCLNMRRASSAITKIYDDTLAPSGITVSQFSILRHILALGPLSVSDLAARLRLDRTTLVRNLKPLEAAQLVADLSLSGARTRRLQVTERGRAIYRDAERLWQEAQSFIEQSLGTEKLAQLTELLSAIERLEA
jgi:DNA-binding MarR family transcriptional regulator